MNDDRNTPKPLPDDFGMTIPNMRLPQQNQPNQGGETDLPTTNLRTPPPAAAPPPKQNVPPPQPDDFGMTVPNLRLPNSHQPPPPSHSNANDLPTTNLRQPNKPPSDADFGLTMNNYTPNQTGSRSADDEFASTVSYIPYPTKPQPQQQQYDNRQTTPPPIVPPAPPAQNKRQGGNGALLAWLAAGGLFFVILIAVLGAVAYFWLLPKSGYTIVIKGAHAGSEVFLDNKRGGVTRPDGSIEITGVEADRRRALKVVKEGCKDYNHTVEGKNGQSEPEIVMVSMNCEGNTTGPVQTNNCLKDCTDDPRVCEAECRALDALDKALTVDELVAAMNLHIINFESNSFIIPPARKRFLERAAEKFKQLKGNPVVEIGGHTDNVGAAAANAKLSENRANAVLTILVNNGVSEKMLKSVGYGSSKPLVPNDSDDNKFKNRRIQYSVLSR